MAPELLVRYLGLMDYNTVWQAMRRFTEQRNEDTPDEIWFLEHPSVFTQGQAGKAEHLLDPGRIPVIQVDRGGQVTYHGPGQLVAYLLIDLKRKQQHVRELVTCIEQGLVRLLAGYNIVAQSRTDAPGVYVQSGAKIAQLGLRVKRQCTFHGLSLNVDMDMTPFLRINPCGHVGMAVTNMALEGIKTWDMTTIARDLLDELNRDLGYNSYHEIQGEQLPV